MSHGPVFALIYLIKYTYPKMYACEYIPQGMHMYLLYPKTYAYISQGMDMIS